MFARGMLLAGLAALAATAPLGAAAAQAGGVADRIRALTEPGGEEAWDNRVTDILSAAYDYDGSGAIDQANEAESIPCDVWAAVDAGVKQEYDYGLAVSYGFSPGTIFAAEPAFRESVRATIYRQLVTCGVADEDLGEGDLAPIDSGDPVEFDAPADGLIRSAAGDIAALKFAGGSPEWEDAVRPLMLALFDANGSSKLDTADEVMQVDCATWSEIDKVIRSAQNKSFDAFYGIAPDRTFKPQLLIDESIRSDVLTVLQSCGLVY